MGRIKILFVCSGNICRSPTAQGIFSILVQQARLTSYFEIDSAGTHTRLNGAPADPRSVATAEHHGVDLSPLRSRRLCAVDYDYYDYIIAMDHSNIRSMLAECDQENSSKIKLLLTYAESVSSREVPDPYGQGIAGFEVVFNLIEQACQGLLATLRQTLPQ